MDIVENVEHSLAANLREVERIRDRRIAANNRSAKIEHFKLMKEMSERSKQMEKETRVLVERLRNGNYA